MRNKKILPFFFAVMMFFSLIAPEVQAASNISATARLAGAAGPVLAAVTNCTLGLVFDKTYKSLRSKLDNADSKLSAQVSLSENPYVANTGGGDFLTSLLQGSGLEPTDLSASEDLVTAAQDAVKAKFNSMCTVPMERAAAQVILNTLTTETISWINGGMNGAPMFVSDPAKALSQLQNNAIGSVAATIKGGATGCDLTKSNAGDNCLYPFGKDILRDTLSQLNSSFESDSKSNLAGLLASQNQNFTIASFSSNLSNGGWSAFVSALQPNNNAIGYNYMTQDYLSYKLQGTQYSPASLLMKQLDWGNGFYSQTKCLDPGMGDWTPTSTTTCNHQQIVTPGRTISASLDKALGNPTDSLLLGNNLDASITSIFDALISKYLKDGLASLSDDTGNNNSGDNTQTENSNQTITGNAKAGSLCGVNSSDDWYAQYPKFSLIGGSLTTLILREEQLESILTTQNKLINNYMIPSIYALDYCVPGPAPFDSQSVSGQALSSMLNNMPSDNNRGIIAQFLNDKLGIMAFPNHKVMNISQLSKIVRGVTSRYFGAVNYYYHDRGSDGTKPVVDDLQSANPSYAEYNRLTYFEQTAADNQATIDQIKHTVGQLTIINNQISSLVQTAQSSGNISGLTQTRDYIRLSNEFNNIIPTLDVSPYSTNNNGVMKGNQNVNTSQSLKSSP